MKMYDSLQREMRRNRSSVGITLNCNDRNRNEWCAFFIGYNLMNAYKNTGVEHIELLKSMNHFYGRVTTMVDKFVESGLAIQSNVPRLGSIFYRSKLPREGSSGGHMGVVVEIDTVNRKFLTVEGNTKRGDNGWSSDTVEYSFDDIATDEDMSKGNISITSKQFSHLIAKQKIVAITANFITLQQLKTL